MSSSDLEGAWRAFEAADVSVDDHLWFQEAELDHAAIARLHEAAAAGDDGAADRLVTLLDRAPSVVALDGVLATALDGCARFGEALAARARALPCAARWHALEVARLCGNLGYDLLELGRLGEARRWYERALRYDPTDPFAIGGLAEVLLCDGDLDGAFLLRNHLAAAGYPAEHHADFDRAFERTLMPRPKLGAYEPDLARIEPLDPGGLARMREAAARDRATPAKELLRGEALAAWRAGERAAAWQAADGAIEAVWPGDPARAAIEEAWARSLAAALDRAG